MILVRNIHSNIIKYIKAGNKIMFFHIPFSEIKRYIDKIPTSKKLSLDLSIERNKQQRYSPRGNNNVVVVKQDSETTPALIFMEVLFWIMLLTNIF